MECAVMRSYLTQREKCESKNDISSGHRLIEYGVPQSSYFGPLLIHTFINDFPKCSFFYFTLSTKKINDFIDRVLCETLLALN